MNETMLRKERAKASSRMTQTAPMVGMVIIYLGVLLIIAALIFMVVRFEEADSIFYTWLTFMVGGILMILVGVLLGGVPRVARKQRKSFNKGK